MIKNIGIDIVENERFKKYLNDLDKVKRFLSNDELEIYKSFSNDSRKLTYLSGRFCGKEAFIKAISLDNLSFNYNDITILNDEIGVPYLKTNFFVNGKIHISISHTNNVSTAICIIEI